MSRVIPDVLATYLDELADDGPPSLSALARDLGLPDETLRRLWHGADPAWETLRRLRAAGVSIDAILDLEIEAAQGAEPAPAPRVLLPHGLHGGIARAATMTSREQSSAAWRRWHPEQEGQRRLPLRS